MAYDNARLPQALIVTGHRHRRAALRRRRAAIAALADGACRRRRAGCFRPVGTDSFGDQRQPPQPFDQQPLEATATISACLAAWRADGDRRLDRPTPQRAFAWFLGSNDLSVPLVDLGNGELPRRTASRPPQREPRRRVGRVLSSRPRGDAPAARVARRTRQVRAASRASLPSALKTSPRFDPNQIEAHRCHTAPRSSNRQALYLRPDPARVVVRPFKPATEPRDLNPDRQDPRQPYRRPGAWRSTPTTAAVQLADVWKISEGRHRNLLATFEARADEMEDALRRACRLSRRSQRQLVGAYFLHEYSFEASALFNPSIVAHPDQSGAPEGGRRFILSLRAVGEGHVSSLTFRSGSIAADGSVTRRSDGAPGIHPRVKSAALRSGRRRCRGRLRTGRGYQRAGDLSRSPKSQSNGIEDARFVEFDEAGKTIYYATYTAYSGRAIRSELIETTDFVSFRMSPLQGSAARNKGMALFPRKIDGKYAMIGRQDNENLYLIYSDDLLRLGRRPADPEARIPWEFVQIGNCGSPIELDEGWLLLTHGVGPVRKYSIGAVAARQERSFQGSRHARGSRWCGPTRRSAKAMFRTSSTPAARCATATRSSCPTRSPTPSPISRPSRSPP